MENVFTEPTNEHPEFFVTGKRVVTMEVISEQQELMVFLGKSDYFLQQKAFLLLLLHFRSI